jgi:Nuclease-related domain
MSYHSNSTPTWRAPGQHTRAIVRRLRMRTLLTLGVLAVATTVLGRTFGWRSAIFLGSEIALLITIFVISRFVLPLVERHDRGAAGEEQVGATLETLSEQGWRVIHDASFGRGNVDHIVIGRAGIFTVETKSHPGPVRVDRIHGAVLGQAQAQRAAVERVVGERVEPLIVFSRAWVDRPLTRRKGVRVLPARMLLGYLQKRRPRLTEEGVQELHAELLAALIAGKERCEDGADGEHAWKALPPGQGKPPLTASLIERGSRWRQPPWG